MHAYSYSSENPFPTSEKYSKARTTVLLDYNMKDNYMRKENERKKKLQAQKRYWWARIFKEYVKQKHTEFPFL